MSDKYDERAHCIVFRKLPRATSDWVVDAITRRVSVVDGAGDLLAWLHRQACPVNTDDDTVLERELSTTMSDTHCD